MSFAASGFARFARSTKRANLLSEMDRIVPWERLCAVVAPLYPTGEGGRPATTATFTGVVSLEVKTSSAGGETNENRGRKPPFDSAPSALRSG